MSIAITALDEGASTAVALKALRPQVDVQVINRVAQFLKGVRAMRALEHLVLSASLFVHSASFGQRVFEKVRDLLIGLRHLHH